MSYNASLKEAIDAINEGLEQLENLVWTSNSISHTSEEIVKEYIASDSNILLNTIHEINESGKYKLIISGKGRSAYTAKASTGKVLYTEVDIDDSYKTSDMVLGAGDQLYLNSSPDSGQYVRIQIVKLCSILDLIVDMLHIYNVTKRELNARIDNLIATAEIEGLPTELLDLRVDFDGTTYTTAQQRFYNTEKRLKILEETVEILKNTAT